jgi:hypothetical protein
MQLIDRDDDFDTICRNIDALWEQERQEYLQKLREYAERKAVRKAPEFGETPLFADCIILDDEIPF